MKRIVKFRSLLFLIMIIAFFQSNSLFSQTAGNLIFSVTTTSSGGYSPKHLVAIWIENSSPSFTKTKMLYASISNWDHLGIWTSRSGGNLVDATTGATLTSHGLLTFIWNATDVSGNVVPDGNYNIWVEMAWASSLTTGKTVTSYPFVKGTSAYSSTPANTTNFLGVNVSWTPSGATLAEKIPANAEAIIFPNPSTGTINIKFREKHESTMIRIYNSSGVQVYKETLSGFQGFQKTLDISKLAPGEYFVNLHFENSDESIRIIKTR
jgi:hypothetical protein